jgi:hypothetical protein
MGRSTVGQTVIPCGEVVRVKQGPDGKVQSYRVRIVAGGHRQVEGLNYTETFSAAAKMPTVRAVLAKCRSQRNCLYEATKRGIETGTGREGIEVEERLVWVETSW